MEHSPAPAAATVSVKITLSGSKRRTRLSVPLRFSQLCDCVRLAFPDVNDFNLNYVDEEGDTIVVNTDADLAEAHNVFKDLGRVPSFIVEKVASLPPAPPKRDVRTPFGRCHSNSCRHNIPGRQSLAKVMEFPLSKKMAAHFAKSGTIPALHLGITCDGSNQHPLIGMRYHKIGKNYDLNELEFAKLTRDEQEKYEVIGHMGAVPIPVKSLKPNQAIHFGVCCDKSNQNPLLGVRYHKIGVNYDLNEKEFSKLPTAEQKKYEMISRPGATPVPVHAAPDCVFVRDVTVSDGKVISPGTLFVKTWLVKTGVDGWPAGCKLTNVDGNKMNSSGSIVLGPQKPHKLVEISIPLTAPSRPGKITSKWRVLGPDGNFFGHTLWTTIVVKRSGSSAPAVATSSSAAAVATSSSAAAVATSSVSAPPSTALKQLLEMGFNLPVETLQRVLDSVGGNVPAAITALLRRNK